MSQAQIRGYKYNGETKTLPNGQTTTVANMLTALGQTFVALRDSSSFEHSVDADGYLVISNRTGSKA
jgi:hypothetical protein|nr:MAG TPA: hypothetical protein [Bacteriophage sp.]